MKRYLRQHLIPMSALEQRTSMTTWILLLAISRGAIAIEGYASPEDCQLAGRNAMALEGWTWRTDSKWPHGEAWAFKCIVAPPKRS